MAENKSTYDLINFVNGAYLGTLSNFERINVGQDFCFPKGLLERNNSRRICICRVVKVEADSEQRESYRVHLKPIENWQFGMNHEPSFGNGEVDWSGSDGWLKRE